PRVLREQSPVLVTRLLTQHIWSLHDGSKVTQQKAGVAEARVIPVEAYGGLEWLCSGTHAGRHSYTWVVLGVAKIGLQFQFSAYFKGVVPLYPGRIGVERRPL